MHSPSECSPRLIVASGMRVTGTDGDADGWVAAVALAPPVMPMLRLVVRAPATGGALTTNRRSKPEGRCATPAWSTRDGATM